MSVLSDMKTRIALTHEQVIKFEDEWMNVYINTNGNSILFRAYVRQWFRDRNIRVQNMLIRYGSISFDIVSDDDYIKYIIIAGEI